MNRRTSLRWLMWFSVILSIVVAAVVGTYAIWRSVTAPTTERTDCGEQDLDVVFAVDISVSMTPYLRPLEQAVNMVLDSHTCETDRFAVVAFPVTDLEPFTLDTDLTKRIVIRRVFRRLVEDQRDLTGGNEPTFEAINTMMNERNPLGISWRPNAKRVLIVVTDELQFGQTGGVHSSASYETRIFALPTVSASRSDEARIAAVFSAQLAHALSRSY